MNCKIRSYNNRIFQKNESFLRHIYYYKSIVRPAYAVVANICTWGRTGTLISSKHVYSKFLLYT